MSEMNELARKFGLQRGWLIGVLDAPAAAMALLLEVAPAGVLFHDTLTTPPYELILCWPQQFEQLPQLFAHLQTQIVPNGAVWMLMPKKKFAKQRGITFTWAEMQEAGLQTKLVDNKVASFSEQDYGTRFVIRRNFRP